MAKKPGLQKPMTEFGASALRQFSGYVREEFLTQLMGWRGTRIYREMRDNDPVIGGMFFSVERLLMGVDITIEPTDQENPDDIEAADFINSALSDTEQPWPELLAEILTFLQYGYAVFEICYKRRQGQSDDKLKNSKYDDGMIGWRKFASRAQESLLHWNFDESGDPVSMVQLLPTGGPLLEVPLAKCLHFKTRLLKNNPEAVSLLRNCYKAYFNKKRIEEIEAIGIERDLTGIPIMWVPSRIISSNDPDDMAQLAAFKAICRDTSRNEQEGFVLPLEYTADGKNKLYEMTLLSTAGRRAFDTSAIIDRYDHRMLASWLADFIVLGTGTSAGRGSFAQSKNKTDMFALAAESFLDFIVYPFNAKAIPDLLALNQLRGSCQMRHGDISEGAIIDFASAVNQVASVGMITPDARTEGAIRGKMGLPPQMGVDMDQDLSMGGNATAGGDDDPDGDEGGEAAAAQAQGDTDAASDDGPLPGESKAPAASGKGRVKTAKRRPVRKVRRVRKVHGKPKGRK